MAARTITRYGLRSGIQYHPWLTERLICIGWCTEIGGPRQVNPDPEDTSEILHAKSTYGRHDEKYIY